MPLNKDESGEDYYKRLRKSEGMLSTGVEAGVLAGLAVADRNQATLDRIKILLEELVGIARKQ